MVLRHWVVWKALERPGMPWKGPRHRTYRGLRPINTAYLPTVDSVVENIVVVYRQSITTTIRFAQATTLKGVVLEQQYRPRQEVSGTRLSCRRWWIMLQMPGAQIDALRSFSRFLFDNRPLEVTALMLLVCSTETAYDSEMREFRNCISKTT